MSRSDRRISSEAINRLCNACIAYAGGKKTMDQVWYHARGDKKMQAIQAFPDPALGGLLYELWMDFFTWYGVRDDIVDQKILRISDYLQGNGRPKSVH